MIHLTSQNYTPKEIIQNVFSPLIGVFSSQQADEICIKNNLTFVEMLQPFSRLSSDASFRDPSGLSVVSVKGLRLNICDINWRPPQTILARKMLNDSVTTAQCEKTKIIHIDDTTDLEIPFSEPWYEQWRETFLTVQFPSDHEFTRHFLSCLIVLSSSDQNVVETANQMTRKVQMMQNVTPPKLPKWFSTDTQNCYVMLHDGGQCDITKAQQGFEALKSTYGENRCFLIQINSVTESSVECPDPWLRYLKRHPRPEQPSSSDPESVTPRTPQDMIGFSSMPTTMLMSTLETPPSEIVTGEVIVHPLSPVQETAVDAMNSSMSTSTESIPSQFLNPNVWEKIVDLDASHGQWLTPSDIENLKHFVQDFTVRGLIPYIEKLIVGLNDSIANKKGVSRSLLSATKRWFVTNKPGTNTAQNAVVYTSESTELQTRKLGDLYFMFGNYNLAFQSYHQAKRDFNADSAWQYYAGALEMAALSAFMQGTESKKTTDYMEEAIHTYLNICKLPQFATRATLLSVECLKASKSYGEAAKNLIRMTSEDSDLRSALLLEQASYCVLAIQPPLYRKYAFHSVLAGHRYSKAGQRKHSYRCYKQAYQVFENRGWSLAEDHIQYTIGKQAVTLKKLEEASNALAHLLRPSSLQTALQQSAFLREYIATQKALLNQNDIKDILFIALPKIVQNLTRVLVTSQPPVSHPHLVPATNININSHPNDEWKWNKLEEMIVQLASKKPVMIFKPSISLFTGENLTSQNPLCIHGEPIEISLTVENTIKPAICFEDIHLLWIFTKDDGEVLTNKQLFKNDVKHDSEEISGKIVAATSVKIIQLKEFERKIINIRLTPHFIGTLQIIGVVGRISALNESANLWGQIEFERIKIRPKDGPAATEKPIEFDKKLEIYVLPPAPALNVSFSETPLDVLAGEIIPININLTNSGADCLSDIFLSSESPRCILVNPDETELPLSILRDFKDLTNEAFSKDKEARKQHVYKLLVGDSILNPKETRMTTIWLQAPYKKGPIDMKVLIYYSMPNGYPKIKHRLVRHSWHFNVVDSISVEGICSIGNITTNELGIDVSIKNLNQQNHSVTTEIMLHDVDLYCSTYSLNSEKIIYMNSPGYYRIFTEESGLKPNESLSLRVPVIEKEIKTTQNPTQFVTNRLSSLEIQKRTGDLSNLVPTFSKIGSFLIKNETKFVQVFGQIGSSEEFNNIISMLDRHMTICVTWKGLIYDNNLSLQRITYGQHFIQLRNLYEPIFCPPKERLLQQTSFISHEELLGIYDFKNTIPKNVTNDDDGWAVHNISVGRRCFLEDEQSGTDGGVQFVANVC